ncbi:MAG: LacI family DNA-binding transcriptional regulator [Planctomycetes bacterium]|nr:LacI family DNA-binding transcriptional regulator [Planctomycetota bacterium]
MPLRQRDQAAVPITMADVAKRCGLSQPAVSQALSGKGRLNAETRARVVSIARDLGYLPNVSARATRSGHLGCVGLLQSTAGWRSLLPSPLLDGIHDALAERDMHLVVAKLADEDLARAAFVPRILRERLADGLIVNFNAAIPAGIRRLIREHGVPAAWLNVRQEYDCVHPDDLGATAIAVRRLVELGHRRIAFADYSHASEPGDAHYSVVDRRAGYQQAMIAAGLTPRLLVERNPVREDQRIAFTRAWLGAADRPTAVVTYGNTIALPILIAAASAGLSVPRDLSVISFSDLDARHLGLELDVMVVPCQAMGRAAVDMLFARARPRRGHPAQAIACAYVPGGSTAPPA